MAKYDIDTTGKDIVIDLGNHAEGKILVFTGPSQNSLGAEMAAKIDPVIEAIKAVDSSIEVSFVKAKGAIVNVTSMAYFIAEVDTKDPNFGNDKTYHPWRAYGLSKTANILFTYSLGRVLKDKGVTAIAADPGRVEPPPLPRVTH
ncbi:hypothetical protein G7Y89_g5705 [Cudoniella acicularis]|uniref:Uncharacterized protein n=1 Tax=Cudoniella acicularis TaxID=354080 RepID=A0A8H4RP61_9HELO|nr:hypothetical protein G7Y89_g5705 [Cudoniella acicularis]